MKTGPHSPLKKSSFPDNVSPQSPSTKARKDACERLATFSSTEKDWISLSRDQVPSSPEKYIPTTVTIISKGTPRSDVDKSYRWVPNASEMKKHKNKARILEMNSDHKFLEMIARDYRKQPSPAKITAVTNKKSRRSTKEGLEGELEYSRYIRLKIVTSRMMMILLLKVCGEKRFLERINSLKMERR